MVNGAVISLIFFVTTCPSGFSLRPAAVKLYNLIPISDQAVTGHGVVPERNTVIDVVISIILPVTDIVISVILFALTVCIAVVLA